MEYQKNTSDEHGFCASKLNPLGIRQLMVITAVAAFFIFWTAGVQTGISRLMDQPFHPIAYFEHILGATACAILLLSPIWFRTNKRVSGMRLLHPGHWFVVIYGLAAVGRLLHDTTMLFFYSETTGFLDGSAMYLAGAIALLSGAAILAFGIAAMFKNSGIWRWTFVLPVFPSIILALIVTRFLDMQTVFWVSNAVPIIAGLLILMAVFVDLANSRIRDWLHWVGIFIAMATLLLIPGLNMFWYLVLWEPRAVSG